MPSYTRQDIRGRDVHLVEEDGHVVPAETVTRMQCGGLRQQLEFVRGMEIRDDDLMIAAYGKSGMHWLWEIVSMVLNKRAEYDKNAKEVTMLDFKSKEHMDDLPSPRILDMHFPVRFLPKQLLEKRRPILHIMRNPKDVFVSQYHHYKALYDSFKSSDAFSTLLPMLIGEHGFYMKAPWSTYELEWEAFTKENPDYPILNIYYEDLKKDPLTHITAIAKFLRVDLSDELLQEITAKSDIKAMQAGIMSVKENGPKTTVDGVPVMYRKGMIGDWKNHFTVAENEKMDKWLTEQLVNTDLKFQYT